MTMTECLVQINNIEIDSKVHRTLSETYSSTFPSIVERIVTFFQTGGFVCDYRFLSLDEIEHADEDLHVDFINRKILPLIDCFDNDFIVYDFHGKKWMKFNIIELVAFNVKDSLEELLEY